VLGIVYFEVILEKRYEVSMYQELTEQWLHEEKFQLEVLTLFERSDQNYLFQKQVGKLYRMKT
jgi:hypothetical protein